MSARRWLPSSRPARDSTPPVPDCRVQDEVQDGPPWLPPETGGWTTSAHAAGLRPRARSLNRNHLLTLILAGLIPAYTRARDRPAPARSARAVRLRPHRRTRCGSPPP